MEVVTTNLGVITAYGDAVAAGYRGTKAEWQALMANYATVGTQAAQDAQTASQAAQTATTKASEASASAIAAQNAASSINTPDATLTQAGVAADAKATGDEISDLKSDFSELYNSAYVTDSASGSIAHFEDGADNIPLKSLKVNIEPVQSGSGDPSPENVRPISGWDSVNVTRTGKNIIIPYVQEVTATGVTASVNADGSVTLNGTSVGIGGVSLFQSFNIRNLNAGTYYARLFGQDLTWLNMQLYVDSSSKFINQSGSFTISDDGLKNFVRIRWDSGITFDNVVVYPMLVVGTNKPEIYEPCQGDVYTVSLASAGTVYGGTLDVVTGILTVYPYYASYNGEVLTGRWISDRDVYAVGTTPTIGAQVVNIGAEGTEYQLEPHEVASLLGTNNIFADTGDCSVEYRADTKLFINRLTEPDADMIADSNITSGSYFMVGNNLFKATANIASGASVIVGTNAIRKSLSEALNEINS